MKVKNNNKDDGDSSDCSLTSAVGIATRYGLHRPVIESHCGGRVGREFPHPSRQALGPTQPPIQWVPGLSWG
jgi:hypothetical protein